jgi:hypothetical protein
LPVIDPDDERLGYHGPKARDRRLAPTQAALRALAEGPKTNAELQEVICDDHSTVTKIMSKQRMQGNVTRVDEGSGSGSIATYGLTQKGKEKIG